MFKLERDLIFFDVETTGLHVIRDRILQIAMVKYFKDGSPRQELKMIIDPGIEIPQEAILIHGIGPEQVRGQKKFCEVAPELMNFIGDADLAGYNSNRFDVPLLAEEFFRCGMDLDLDRRRLIDVQRIFYKMEPRTLKAAYQFYCNEELVDAHDALADVLATVKVLEGQLARYENVPYLDEEGKLVPQAVRKDVQALHDFTNDLKTPDATQRLRYNEKKEMVFNFGKYNGKTLDEVWIKEPAYFDWILNMEFSYQVKKIIRGFRDERKSLKT